MKKDIIIIFTISILLLISTICMNERNNKEFVCGIIVEEPTIEIEYFTFEYEPPLPYLDIGLSEELQEFTRDMETEYGIPSLLLISVMYQESRFQPDVVSKKGAVGLMQIGKVNHDWLTEALQCDNIIEEKTNIQAGTIILYVLYTKYHDWNQVLMAYNMGEYRAKSYWNRGIYQSKYSKEVLERYATYIRTTEISREEPQFNIWIHTQE